MDIVRAAADGIGGFIGSRLKCGHQRGKQRREDACEHREPERCQRWRARIDFGVQENRTEFFAEFVERQAGHRNTERHTERGPDDAEQDGGNRKQSNDLPPRRADRPQNTDVVATFGDCYRERVVNEKQSDDHRAE